MKKITEKTKELKVIFGNTKYSVDYYQREYKWKTKQVKDLIEDLTSKFFENYQEGHVRGNVSEYNGYFLGFIITSEREGKKFIIDGQQRLTTLTLLFIYLYKLLENAEDRNQISNLIYSSKYGKKSYNLEIEEREPFLNALFKGEPFDVDDHPESVKALAEMFAEIEDLFPDTLKKDLCILFVDWLIEKVLVVEITANSDADAYTIFETINDRGLSLTQVEMLKGYLLTNIDSIETRNRANGLWKERVNSLRELGKDEDSDCIKAWLRGQYANSIRERKANAEPGDFDLLATEFHRWIRDNKEKIGLKKSKNFENFIFKDFKFYTTQYERLRKATKDLTPGLEEIYYNAQNNYTLQYPVLLSALKPTDKSELIIKKLQIVSIYLNILIARRVWNWRSIDYSTMQYAMYLIMKEIRNKSIDKISDFLYKKTNEEEETFITNDRFSLTGGNKTKIHLFLARLTEFIETSSGMPSQITNYLKRSGPKGFEVEHIWANHPGRHNDDFDHPNDFQEYRNRIGGLVLLPRDFNRSYGDLPYSDADSQKAKLTFYDSQNLLVRSLHPNCYKHNPGFLRFIKETELPFKAHKNFRKTDFQDRQILYQKISEKIWNPERLLRK